MADLVSGRLYFGQYFQNAGNIDMAVDGSSAPVRYSVRVETLNPELDLPEIVVFSVKLVLSGGALTNPLHFGGLSNPLTNGVKVGIREIGGEEFSFSPPLKTNADIHSIGQLSGTIEYLGIQRDVIYGTFFTVANPVFRTVTTEEFFLDIEDNLAGLDFFRAYLTGYYKPIT